MTDRPPTGAPPSRRRWAGSRPSRAAALGVGGIALATVLLPLGVVVPILAVVTLAGAVLVDLAVAGRSPVSGTRSPVPTLALRVPVDCTVGAAPTAGQLTRLRQPVPAELSLEPDEAQGAVLTGRLLGRHRGVHELPAAVARVSGPLRLATSDHEVAAAQRVTVFPDLPRARRLAAARRRGRADDSGRARSPIGLGTEFESIRDYSTDDDVRHINWVATSRVGRPMSNQYRFDENRDVVCVVDTGRLMASPVGDLTRLDVALDALTVLAVAAEDAGDRVGAIAFDAAVTRQLAPRRRGAESLVRALFDLEPREVESDYERAFLAVGRHRRALVAIFTDLVDEEASRSLVAAASMLTRHHSVLVASCRDPDLERLVGAEPGDVGDVLRAALSLDLLGGQDRAAALLRAGGAAVVVAPGDRLGSACVQAYLGLKQRARL